MDWNLLPDGKGTKSLLAGWSAFARMVRIFLLVLFSYMLSNVSRVEPIILDEVYTILFRAAFSQTVRAPYQHVIDEVKTILFRAAFSHTVKGPYQYVHMDVGRNPLVRRVTPRNGFGSFFVRLKM